MIQLFDTVAIEGVRITNDGYLTATAPVARTGIQEYAGYEVDPDNSHGLRDKAIVKVYRPPEQVFDKKTLHSFAHRPVTNDHPPVLVDSSNWKEYAVGQTGDEVDARDGKLVRVPLCVMDAATIKDVKDGKRELSMGYQTALDFTAGTTPDGEAYDAVQTAMRMNHLAIVHRARGGEKLRIGDNRQGDRPMTDKLQTVTVDGISIETTAQAAQVIAKLQGQLDSASTTQQTALAAKDATIADLNKQLATKDAALDAAKKEVLSDADLDARVAARSQLLADAAAVAPSIETKGLSDADIRKAAVTAALGDAAVAGKPQAYIDARFDILVEDAAAGERTVATLSAAQPKQVMGDAAAAEAAYAANVSDLNGWRNKR